MTSDEIKSYMRTRNWFPRWYANVNNESLWGSGVEEEDVRSMQISPTKYAVFDIFVWSRTLEGFAYWSKVNEELYNYVSSR